MLSTFFHPTSFHFSLSSETSIVVQRTYHTVLSHYQTLQRIAIAFKATKMSFSHINSLHKGTQGAFPTAMTPGSDGEAYMVDSLTLLAASESTTPDLPSSGSEPTGPESPRVGMPTIDKLRCATAMYGTESHFNETEADGKMATLLYVSPGLSGSFPNYTLLDHANAFEAAQICYPAEMSIFIAK